MTAERKKPHSAEKFIRKKKLLEKNEVKKRKAKKNGEESRKRRRSELSNGQSNQLLFLL